MISYFSDLRQTPAKAAGLLSRGGVPVNLPVCVAAKLYCLVTEANVC